MQVADILKNDSEAEAAIMMTRIKKRIDAEKQDIKDNYRRYIPSDWNIIVSQLRQERFTNRDAIKKSEDEMRLNFVVPEKIYYSDVDYWKMVCHTPKLRLKYPEFIIGN